MNKAMSGACLPTYEISQELPQAGQLLWYLVAYISKYSLHTTNA